MNKKVIKYETIKKLAELFPTMTVLDLIDYIELCQELNKEAKEYATASNIPSNWALCDNKSCQWGEMVLIWAYRISYLQ